MNQNIWGSHMWFSLHTITFNYPLKPTKEDITNYKNFIISLKYVIPCSACKKNYTRHLNELPIDKALLNRKNFVYWMIDMHNAVNGEIGKKIWSYDEVIKKYEQVYNKKIELNSDNKSSNESFNVSSNVSSIERFSNSEETVLYEKNIISYILILFIILLIINLLVKIYKSK
jgi:hypothetical protein